MPPAAPRPEALPAHVEREMHKLRRWANRLRGRYGVPIYLVGSALREDNPDPRDWDIRIMLPDDRFALAFGPVAEWRDEGCTGAWTRTRFRWSAQCVKDTEDFAAWVHLNGDVQIYPESHAVALYADKPRVRLDSFPDEDESAARPEALPGGRERAAFWRAVCAEIDHAYAKHGRDPWGRHEFYAIMREEVDEAWDDIKADAPTAQLLAEVVQIAAMCLRYAETGDRYLGQHPDIPCRAALAAVERAS